jgi:hypothetical protein
MTVVTLSGAMMAKRPDPAGVDGRLGRGATGRGLGRTFLPDEALKQLLQPHVGVGIGQIWVIPTEHLNWKSTSPARWCVLLALEDGATGPPPVRGHFVVGSTKPEFDRLVQVVDVPAGEGGLEERTLFAFKASSAVPLGLLRMEGDFKGTLSSEWIDIMFAAIKASPQSTLITLRRLIRDA